MSKEEDPIGLMLNCFGPDRIAALRRAAELGFRIVHMAALPEAWLTGPPRERFVSAVRDTGLTVACMFVGFDGQSYADLSAIARTVGLVQPELRPHRVEVVRCYNELAAEAGAPALGLHLGFLPPAEHADFPNLVSVVRDLAQECGQRGQQLLVETGQEPAAGLLAFLQAVNHPALGVNFDPANFLLYDSDDPLHALGVLGAYIRGVHCKDGVRPHQAGTLGAETSLGQGSVDLAGVLSGLLGAGYRGPYVLEREGSADPEGEILAGRDYLRRLLQECGKGRMFRAEH